jgi:hypothetical protein
MRPFIFLLILVCPFTLYAQTEPSSFGFRSPNAKGGEPTDVPTITPFPASKDLASRAAVVVLPGGGYSHLSEIKEGSDVARWLNSLGITAFVLKYRLGMAYHQPNSCWMRHARFDSFVRMLGDMRLILTRSESSDFPRAVIWRRH